MWKITALALAFAISIPTAQAEPVDTLTLTSSEIELDENLSAMAKAIYFIGQQSEPDQTLIIETIEDFNISVEASGSALDTKEMHGLCEDLVYQLRDEVGDALTWQLLSLDAMAPFRLALIESTPREWASSVDALGLSGLLSYDTEDMEPEAKTDWEDIGPELGAALGGIGGALAGSAAGGVGVATGAAAGATLGAAIGGMVGAVVDEMTDTDDDSSDVKPPE
jgi:hypothetical protein